MYARNNKVYRLFDTKANEYFRGFGSHFGLPVFRWTKAERNAMVFPTKKEARQIVTALKNKIGYWIKGYSKRFVLVEYTLQCTT